MITPSRMAWPPENVMVRMETDPAHSTAWINTFCVPVGVSSWAEICLFRQSVAGPAVTTPFFFFRSWNNPLIDHVPRYSLWHQRLLSWLGVMSKLEPLMWEEIRPAAAQGTLSSSGLWSRGVILASSISIKCSFLIKRKVEKNEEKEGKAACWKITLTTVRQTKHQMCAMCIFILSEGKGKATTSHVQ